MFEIIRRSLKTGVVTSRYPAAPAEVSGRARGRPEIDFANWRDARPAAAACPTGAIALADDAGAGQRTTTLDLGKCIFCGLCADADGAIRMTNQCELAARRRGDLQTAARYSLHPDGSHARLLHARTGGAPADGAGAGAGGASNTSAAGVESLGRELNDRIGRLFGRSLHIREVDAGSCNGCEVEIVALNNPIYDIERFGIHFVASPRHADMLLVTGPVTRNMELALRRTYDAMPEPRLVVAVGACGCSGGIFGENYASRGGVDRILPVDVYIPGCPPNPHALLHGILLAVERLEG